MVACGVWCLFSGPDSVLGFVYNQIGDFNQKPKPLFYQPKPLLYHLKRKHPFAISESRATASQSHPSHALLAAPGGLARSFGDLVLQEAPDLLWRLTLQRAQGTRA